ncbi:MAG: hypothetical protein IMF06_06575 [Proteobacteria bacterium]|nr:hypothetical protein [Pseudomonadota bacterium]
MISPPPALPPWRKAACRTLVVCTVLFTLQAHGQSDLAQDRDEKDVARLLSLISRHYEKLEESKKTQPSEEELAARGAAKQDAAKLATIPFSADKVRLNGSEGNTALAHMTQRLSDQSIPESRRDLTVICSIKTHLFGTLIASENRSLAPAGKNQYIARIRLQPGKSTLRVGDDLWEVSLPQDMNAADYLITLYAPPDQEPEFHVFSVADLLGEEKPHIPAWLPPGIKLNPSTG